MRVGELLLLIGPGTEPLAAIRPVACATGLDGDYAVEPMSEESDEC